MSLELQVKVNFPAEENKLVPCLFALEVSIKLHQSDLNWVS